MQICYNTLFKMSSFQQQEKNDTYKKKQEIMTHVLEIKKKKGKRNCCECDPLLDLTHKYFKITIVNMFKELKKITKK